jgi:hypothetical protein
VEKVKINPTSPIVFKKNVLKKEWLKGNLPTVQKGIYGGILTKDNISLEHVNCKCFGGKTKTFNLALATQEFNNLRGNQPLKDFLNKDVFIQYLEQFEKVDLPNFNGIEYIKGLIKTVIDVLETGK